MKGRVRVSGVLLAVVTLSTVVYTGHAAQMRRSLPPSCNKLVSRHGADIVRFLANVEELKPAQGQGAKAACEGLEGCNKDIASGAASVLLEEGAGLGRASASVDDTAAMLRVAVKAGKTMVTEKVKSDNLEQVGTKQSCPGNCNEKGICTPSGKCLCQPGIGGEDCSIDQCSHLNSCSMHGQCRNAKCACDPGYEGKDCSAKMKCPGGCSQHGTCKWGKCFCDLGFEGDACAEESKCPKGCSGNGICDRGQCLCSPGFGLEDCSEVMSKKQCPKSKAGKECSGKTQGECRMGKCYCMPGFDGDACEDKLECEKDCSGHGECFFGTKCLCYPGYEGNACENAAGCPGSDVNGKFEMCSGNGECRDGLCFCTPGYKGNDCKEREKCPNDCSGRGLCAGGECFCSPGFSGHDCSISKKALADRERMKGCPRECSGNGICAYGMSDTTGSPLGECLCMPGFSGADCGKEKACPDNCGGHGVCVAGICHCEGGYGGDNCGTVTFNQTECPQRCSGNGVCVVGQCFCDPGFTGDACERSKPCPGTSGGINGTATTACSGHGQCSRGECFCEPGYEGKDCRDRARCKNDCSNHGICVMGKCICETSYVGEDCSLSPSCAQHPCKHGLCRLGKCYCEDGWTGAACSIESHDNSAAIAKASKEAPVGETCKNKCSGHGTCDISSVGANMCFTCTCYGGFKGHDCSVPDVLISARISCRMNSSDCGPHGTCLSNGKCACQDGWGGRRCLKDLMAVPETEEEKLSKKVQKKIKEDEKNRTIILTGEGNRTDIAVEPEEFNATDVTRSDVVWVKMTRKQSKVAREVIMTREATRKQQASAAKALDATMPTEPTETTAAESAAAEQKAMEVQNALKASRFRSTGETLLKSPNKEKEEDVEKEKIIKEKYAAMEKKLSAKCQKGCEEHGQCVLGKCYCNPGYMGSDCAMAKACMPSPTCSGHGQCSMGKCFCEPGFEGPGCGLARHKATEKTVGDKVALTSVVNAAAAHQQGNDDGWSSKYVIAIGSGTFMCGLFVGLFIKAVANYRKQREARAILEADESLTLMEGEDAYGSLLSNVGVSDMPPLPDVQTN